MNNTLLPCPFCGGEAKLHDGVVVIPVIDENGAYIDADVEDTPAWVECAACGAATDGVDSADEAIAAWNRRADHIRDTTKKVSNADRIRKTTDEELARWLVDATVCERVCDEDEYCHGNECVKRVTDWLKQPAKEEHHEDD